MPGTGSYLQLGFGRQNKRGPKSLSNNYESEQLSADIRAVPEQDSFLNVIRKRKKLTGQRKGVISDELFCVVQFLENYSMHFKILSLASAVCNYIPHSGFYSLGKHGQFHFKGETRDFRILVV